MPEGQPGCLDIPITKKFRVTLSLVISDILKIGTGDESNTEVQNK